MAAANPDGPSGALQPLQPPRDREATGPSTGGPDGAAPRRHLVFVYGTLKRGGRNHHWLKDASWAGEASLDGVVLHDLGPFPMAVIGAGTAFGEVYAVEASGLDRLDELEGYPRLYDRRQLPLNDGRLAWIYLGRARQVRHAPAVSGGTWPPDPARSRYPINH